jgi:hypothetical protein
MQEKDAIMILLPGHLVENNQIYCRLCGIRDSDRADWLKWLRFFLDFSEKYHVTREDSQRISLFTGKLKEKKQGEEQRQ